MKEADRNSVFQFSSLESHGSGRSAVSARWNPTDQDDLLCLPAGIPQIRTICWVSADVLLAKLESKVRSQIEVTFVDHRKVVCPPRMKGEAVSWTKLETEWGSSKAYVVCVLRIVCR